jgi:uncharacterized protein (TIGR02246 family)
MHADRDIEECVNRLERAWNRHDARAFAAVFQPDGILINMFGIELTGRAAIERVHDRTFATMFRDSRLQTDPGIARFLRADVATVPVRWRMTGAYGADGSPRPDLRGLMTATLTCDGGAWHIAVLHNMELPDPTEVVPVREMLAAAGA